MFRSQSSVLQTVDRGVTSSLLNPKKNTIIPYFDQSQDTIYNEVDGEILGSSYTDKFNKQLIANLNPKTMQEELNIKNRMASLSKLSIQAKKEYQKHNQRLKRDFKNSQAEWSSNVNSEIWLPHKKSLPVLHLGRVASLKN